MTKLSRKVQVRNPLGLHARPATVIARLLQKARCTVSFSYRGETVNARSIMSLLMLAAPKDARITIITEGEDAAEVLSQLVHVFESGFGEFK